MCLFLAPVLWAGLFAGVVHDTGAKAQGPPLSSLDDLFDMDDLLNTPLAAHDPRGPSPVFNIKFTLIEQTGLACIYTGYPSSEDPLNDPQAIEIEVSSRATVEIYMPPSPDFNDLDTAYMMIWEAPAPCPGEPETLATRTRRTFGRKAAEKGIPICVFFPKDIHPVVPGQPTDTCPAQLGSTDGRLSRESLDWMMRKDPSVTPLDLDDFRRLWRHYGIAQRYIRISTFVQQLLRDTYGPPADAWVDALKTVLGGGSKGVGGVIAAAGVDPRVKGVRFSGSQEFNADLECAQRRYVIDWGECPGGQHRRADFASWAYEHRFDSPSYFDIHIAGHDPARYQDKLWLDVVGTHDWSTPLGSHFTWWDARDGLINGMVDPGEEAWTKRIVRRPNANHGISYIIGLRGMFEVDCTTLLVWRLMRHFVLGTALPAVDMVSIDVSNPASWTARVRATETNEAVSLDFNAWVMMSDDRDTRRCSDPILNVENGNCFDGTTDDNIAEEDFFIQIPVTSAVQNGEFYDLTWTPPSELSAFTPSPKIDVFIEMIARGPAGNSIVDDTFVHTEVATANRSQYAPRSCP